MFVFRVIPSNEASKLCKLEVHLPTCTIYQTVRWKKSYCLIYVWRFCDKQFQSYIRNCWGHFLEYISIKYIADWNGVGLGINAWTLWLFSKPFRSATPLCYTPKCREFELTLILATIAYFQMSESIDFAGLPNLIQRTFSQKLLNGSTKKSIYKYTKDSTTLYLKDFIILPCRIRLSLLFVLYLSVICRTVTFLRRKGEFI